MLKILLVKTSSLGDLIHTMPAVSDVQKMLPSAELHWLVEEGMARIPAWHPFIKKVHVCAIRRWRKSFFSSKTKQEIKQLKQSLLTENFDIIIDAQGLIKSAFMVRWFDVPRHGYDKNSIKEKLACVVYSDKHNINRKLSAIERVRQLFSQSLNYSIDNLSPEFGLNVQRPSGVGLLSDKRYVIFMHGTVWESKIWPIQYWKALAVEMERLDLQVFIPWGNDEEYQRALVIADGTKAIVLDRLPLDTLAFHLQHASYVIGSDTGLTHLAAALSAKTIGLYGSTSVQLTGLNGKNVISLQSSKPCSPCLKRHCPLIKEGELIPCYESINPVEVMRRLDRIETKEVGNVI